MNNNNENYIPNTLLGACEEYKLKQKQLHEVSEKLITRTYEIGEENGLLEGIKADDGKMNWEILLMHFPRSLEGVAGCCNYGAVKYKESVETKNWAKIKNPIGRYRKALLRHIFAMLRGEMIDPESGCYHIHHAIWNLLVLSEFLIYGEPQNKTE